MLKSPQARLQPSMNHEIPDVEPGFRRGRGTRDQIANIHWIIDKARKFQKNIYSALLTMPKPLTVWITTNWKILKGRITRSPDLPLEKNLFLQVRRQQLELDMEQQTGPKSGKEYVKAVYCHPAYLTYLQSTS